MFKKKMVKAISMQNYLSFSKLFEISGSGAFWHMGHPTKGCLIFGIIRYLPILKIYLQKFWVHGSMLLWIQQESLVNEADYCCLGTNNWQQHTLATSQVALSVLLLTNVQILSNCQQQQLTVLLGRWPMCSAANFLCRGSSNRPYLPEII